MFDYNWSEKNLYEIITNFKDPLYSLIYPNLDYISYIIYNIILHFYMIYHLNFEIIFQDC